MPWIEKECACSVESCFMVGLEEGRWCATRGAGRDKSKKFPQCMKKEEPEEEDSPVVQCKKYKFKPLKEPSFK